MTDYTPYSHQLPAHEPMKQFFEELPDMIDLTKEILELGKLIWNERMEMESRKYPSTAAILAGYDDSDGSWRR